jgi:hypothetical protein
MGDMDVDQKTDRQSAEADAVGRGRSGTRFPTIPAQALQLTLSE